MSADAPRRLGRGLEALISTAKQQREPSGAGAPATSGDGSELRRIRVADVGANRFQPRRTFTESDLAELEASIRTNGLLQPISVRSRPGGGWELVAGERRLRAAGRLGWTEIPAVVHDFDDQAMLTLALVENLQRADLNPLEEARGYQRLVDEFGLTQAQVADAVGKDRTTITNLLRILTLPPAVQAMVEQGHLTAGHARALLPIRDARRQVDLANEIVARQLSVRDAESRAREGAPDRGGKRGASRAPQAQTTAPGGNDPAIRRVEEQLRRKLQTDVSIQPLGGERGVLRVSYYSADDLERLLDLMVGPRRDDFD